MDRCEQRCRESDAKRQKRAAVIVSGEHRIELDVWCEGTVVH